MLKGFRDFVLRGNVMDLAVAVIIGAAFTAIVTALTENIIKPLLGALIGKPDFGYLVATMKDGTVKIRRSELPHPRLCRLLLPRAAHAVSSQEVQPTRGRTTVDQGLPAMPGRHPGGGDSLQVLHATCLAKIRSRPWSSRTLLSIP
jgi:hypothetical protein